MSSLQRTYRVGRGGTYHMIAGSDRDCDQDCENIHATIGKFAGLKSQFRYDTAFLEKRIDLPMNDRIESNSEEMVSYLHGVFRVRLPDLVGNLLYDLKITLFLHTKLE